MKSLTYTIAIPVFERTLGFLESLQSALNVLDCTEIIVVDDNSSHKEFEIICSSIDDLRVRYHKNTTNLGIFANWNRCVSLANSEYISILCSDDIIESQAFCLFKNAVGLYPKIDVFFGSFCIFQDTVDRYEVIREYPEGHYSSQEFLEDMVKNGPGFPVLTITKKSILIEYPFVSSPHSGNDWLWIYSNAQKLNLYSVNQPISYWRRHANQDAALRQSITLDCWPLMYKNVNSQLVRYGSKYANLAKRRAIGTILSFVLNNPEKYLEKRITIEANNQFLITISEIISTNWLLSALVKGSGFPFFFNFVGRLFRKFKLYPA